MIEKRFISLLLLWALGACGGSTAAQRPGAIVAAVVPDVLPEAERHFEEGMRIMGLGPRHYAEARAALQKAVKVDKNLYEAWHNLGFVDSRQGRFDEAADNYEKALAIQPASRNTLLGLAEALQQAGKSARAQAILRQWTKAQPEDLDVGLLYVAALRDGGKAKEALEVVSTIVAADSRNARTFNALGLVYRKLHKPGLAHTALVRATELDPKAAYVWNNLGLLALDKGDDQEAFAHFSQAVQLDPQYVQALLNKAVVYMDCGAYERAGKELRLAAAVTPEDPDIHVALGVVARGEGKFSEAEKHYREALAIYPDYPPALYNLGVLYMDFKEDHQRARESFKHYRLVAGSADPKKADAKMRLKMLQ